MNKAKLKLILLSFFAAWAMIGCQPSGHNVGKDGYYFEKETFTRTEFPVKVILVKDAAAISAEVAKRKAQYHGELNTKEVMAFTVLSSKDPTCTIYMVDPKNKYQPEYIGHEFVHCIYGTWHQEPQPVRN